MTRLRQNPNRPHVGLPDRSEQVSSKFEDFLLAEYQRIAEAHFSTVSAISQFFQYFIVIAGAPISAAGGEVGEMFHYAINQPITDHH